MLKSLVATLGLMVLSGSALGSDVGFDYESAFETEARSASTEDVRIVKRMRLGDCRFKVSALLLQDHGDDIETTSDSLELFGDDDKSEEESVTADEEVFAELSIAVAPGSEGTCRKRLANRRAKIGSFVVVDVASKDYAPFVAKSPIAYIRLIGDAGALALETKDGLQVQLTNSEVGPMRGKLSAKIRLKVVQRP